MLGGDLRNGPVFENSENLFRLYRAYIILGRLNLSLNVC